MPPIIFENPQEYVTQNFAESIALPEFVLSKLLKKNKRIELYEDSKFIFVISYLSEYDKLTKAVKQVEIDIYFDVTANQAYIFAYDTKTFFAKYGSFVRSYRYKNFGEFIYTFMDTIFDDEVKQIEHILEDTTEIKNEYYAKTSANILIRHLTNNQINISSLKLMSSNQTKIIESVKDYLTNTQKNRLHFKKTGIVDDLVYAGEFCHALMDSINTTFEVKTSNDIYIWTKFTFIAIVGTFLFDIFEIFIMHSETPLFPWSVVVLLCTVLTLFTLKNFRKE